MLNEYFAKESRKSQSIVNTLPCNMNQNQILHNEHYNQLLENFHQNHDVSSTSKNNVEFSATNNKNSIETVDPNNQRITKENIEEKRVDPSAYDLEIVKVETEQDWEEKLKQREHERKNRLTNMFHGAVPVVEKQKVKIPAIINLFFMKPIKNK